MRALGWLLLVSAVACGPAAPYPEVPAPAPASSSAALQQSASDDDPPLGPPLEPFELAWARQTQPFIVGLALSAEHVAVLSSQHLKLLSLRSGAVLTERSSCARFAQAFAFVGADQGAMLCDDGVHLLAVPSLEERAVHPLAGSPRHASFAHGRVAVAFEGGPLRLYASDGWSEERTIDVGSDVTALDLSADGKWLAVGLGSGEALLYRLQGNELTRITIRRTLPVDALAWTGGGGSFFAAAGPLAATFGADGKLQKRISMLAGVRAARWLSPRQIGTAGREGLLVADAISGAVGGIGGGLTGDLRPVALAAAGGALCSASLDGVVACFSRGDLPASPQLPLAAGLPAGELELAAQVTHHDDQVISVAPLPAMPFAPEDRELILLRFSQPRVAGARSARWIEAARCRLVDAGTEELELRIVSRPEGVAVPLEPFSKGDPVKLRWRSEADR